MKKLFASVLAVSMLVLVGCEVALTSDNGLIEVSNSEVSQEVVTSQLLYGDDKVKVSFVEIFEMPGLVGTCYLRLNVENKSDKTVTVSLKDSYINDTAQMIGSGIPMVLAPGMKSLTPFFFGYGNLGINSKDEINKIEFKVWLLDDDYNTVVETESLVIDLS